MDVVTVVLRGLPLTLVVTLVSFAIGLVLAVPLAAASRSRFAALRFAVRAVVDVLRGVPPIVWLFLLYFGLTFAFSGVRLSSLQAGVIGLGVISAAYLAEILRGAVAGIPKGQWEAGAALGLRSLTQTAYVIAPQAARIALPSATTYLIGLLKDSSIVSTIGLAEIVYNSNQYARQTGDGLTVFLVAAAVYIALSVPLGLASRRLDANLRRAVVRV